MTAEDAEALGLVTAAYDDTDWDDEVRLMLEERASFSPDALTAMEANLRFAGPETMETRIFGRLTAWQNWVFQRPNAVGEAGSLKRYGSGLRPNYDPNASDMETRRMPDGTAVDYDGLIPNNVGLDDDARVRKALETWHPGYIDWWQQMGPEGFQDRLVYLRTAVGVGSEGLGEVRLREDAGISLGRPAGARGGRPQDSASARTRASRRGRRCPANIARCCGACW